MLRTSSERRRSASARRPRMREPKQRLTSPPTELPPNCALFSRGPGRTFRPQWPLRHGSGETTASPIAFRPRVLPLKKKLESKPMTPSRVTIDGPRSLARVMQIVAHVADRENGASLAELSVTLEAPKSSVRLLLAGLADKGFLVRKGDQYLLGPAMFELASAVLKRRSFPELARQVMRKLWEETGETVILAVLKPEAEVAVYVDQLESANPVRFSARIGDTRPLYCTAAGRVLLAFQPKEWRESYLRKAKFTRLTEHTIVNRAEVKRRVEQARREFFSMSVEEATDGGAGLAAPVFDQTGHIVAALVIGPVAARARLRSTFYKECVMRAAGDMSRSLGCPEWGAAA
jgi:IclR family transcriptional regulator, acetate operon repressor